jgi:acyl carrier protein
MTDTELTAAIVEGLRRVAPEADPAQLAPAAPLRETLDIDSFDFLNFLVGLHKALGVEIPESDYGQLTTLESLRAYLRARVTRTSSST